MMLIIDVDECKKGFMSLYNDKEKHDTIDQNLINILVNYDL